MLSADQLKAFMPRCDVARWLAPLNDAMVERSIVSAPRMAAFLAQIAHESGECTRLVEGGSYSAEALFKQWRTHFPTMDVAQAYARKPEPALNRAYADRMGNGPEASGDGWRYRGRGLVQITGKAGYKACGAALGVDLVERPERLTEPALAARSAAWWWQAHGLNQLADAGGDANFRQITRVINGGLNGFVERRDYWLKARAALA